MGYYVKVEPDVKIYVEDVNPGGDKTILFVHGWPLNHNQYEYQFNVLPGKGYRCIGMDLRGFGKSDKPWHGYCLDRMADDVRGVVEALQLKNFTLAGHSYGGAASIRYMARHAGYGVSRLALFGAAAPSVTQRPNFPYGQPKENVTALIENSLNDRPNMLRGLKDIFFFQNVSTALGDWFFDLGLVAAGHSTAKVAQSFRDEELFSDLGKIHVPTLILHGIHDKICYPELAVAQKEGIPDAKLVWFEFSGHALFYEERDKFNSELMKFIEH
ncbi:non-heme chloroperoxidase [Fontibacillus solani]|uniref:Non-heme chloroperoxidase n=1 Tax=Fontibacillus solani TaxID=1572857 RepID=A0A7W3SPH3_9BACL|nr:alpha/beta hydrolase [Fontibacillus solani]MBA9083699.1 non-heme chloroperoxidase [Fontibacillus solani]